MALAVQRVCCPWAEGGRAERIIVALLNGGRGSIVCTAAGQRTPHGGAGPMQAQVCGAETSVVWKLVVADDARAAAAATPSLSLSLCRMRQVFRAAPTRRLQTGMGGDRPRRGKGGTRGAHTHVYAADPAAVAAFAAPGGGVALNGTARKGGGRVWASPGGGSFSRRYLPCCLRDASDGAWPFRSASVPGWSPCCRRAVAVP